MHSLADAARTCGRGAAAAVLVLLVLLMLTAEAYAAQEDVLATETQRLLERMDIDTLQELVPETDLEFVMNGAAQGKSLADPQQILQKLSQLAGSVFQELLPELLRIAGIGVLSAGISQLGLSREVGKICELAGSLCTALMALRRVIFLFDSAKLIMQRITGFTGTILPTMLALLTACGGERSAAGLNRLTLAATGAFAELMQGVLMMLLGCGAALVLFTAAADGKALKGAHRMLRNAVHWVLGFCFTAFLGCLALQGGIGMHYDGVALRAARFAVDKSIPVVGGIFKDASDTLIGCALIVKNAVGTAGLTAILSMLMLPSANVLCSVFGFRLCAAALEPFGAGRVCTVLNGLANILITLFILILSEAAMCLMALAALMAAGVGFI